MDHNNSTMIVNSLLILGSKQTIPEAYTSTKKKKEERIRQSDDFHMEYNEVLK